MDHSEDHDKKFKGAPEHKAPEPDQSKNQMNESEDKLRYMDHPKSLDQKFKGEPRHKAPEPDQPKNQYEGKVGYMDHPEGLDKEFKGEPPHEAPEPDPSKKHKNHSKGNVDYTDHPEGPAKNIKDSPQHKSPKPDQSEKQINQFEDEVDYIDPNKGPDKKFKGEPQHEAPKLDESNQSEGNVDFMDHPEGPDKKFKGELQHEAPKLEESKKQPSQSEDEVGYMDHPKGPDRKFKGASQPKDLEPDQYKKQMNQSEAKDTPKSDDKGKQSLQTTEKVVPPEVGPPKVETEGEDKINDTGVESIPGNKSSEDSSSHLSEASKDQAKGEIAPKKKHFWNNWAVIGDVIKASIPKLPKISSSKNEKEPEIDLPDEKQQEHIEVKIDEADTEAAAEVVTAESTPLITPTVSASSKTLEILKSIVYGGLLESLASLSVVTSAASADASTLNIVALAIANLIGGLFVLAHNLEELKSEQVDRYNEILGQTENFILHATLAVLSFIAFGLVAPLVYGFSFRESDEKDLKVAAVAAASLLCIILLSIAKAYTKKPNSYVAYFKTVLYYVSTAAVASVLAYLAGDLIKKLIQKLGWFHSTSSFSMQISQIGVQQPSWGSY